MVPAAPVGRQAGRGGHGDAGAVVFLAVPGVQWGHAVRVVATDGGNLQVEPGPGAGPEGPHLG